VQDSPASSHVLSSPLPGRVCAPRLPVCLSYTENTFYREHILRLISAPWSRLRASSARVFQWWWWRSRRRRGGERDGEEEEQDLLEVRRRWGLLSQEVGLQKLLDTLSHLR